MRYIYRPAGPRRDVWYIYDKRKGIVDTYRIAIAFTEEMAKQICEALNDADKVATQNS